MNRDTRYYYFMHCLQTRQEERTQLVLRDDIPSDVKDHITQSVSDCNELLSMVLNLEEEIESLPKR